MNSTPTWFQEAISTPADNGSVVVDGAKIAYRAWGSPGDPGVALVHGGGAHAGWWDHIGPLLSHRARVVALDLSGHGDSDRRGTYSPDLWAAEVIATANAADTCATEPLLVVGHSLGGMVSARTAVLFRDKVKGVAVIDTQIFDRTRISEAPSNSGPSKTGGAPAIPRLPRTYSTRADALARFRLIPDHPCPPYTKRHVAEQSVVSVDGGWRWKFDPGFVDLKLTDPLFTPVDCQVTIVRAQHGLMTSEMASSLAADLGGHPEIIEIPGAGHHVLLDQPLALVSALRSRFTVLGARSPAA